MKFKTAHAKVLSLLLTLVMVLSTAAVFAEGEENAAANEPVVTTQEDQSVEAAEEEPTESDVVLDVQDDEAVFSIEPISANVEVGGEPVTLTVKNTPSDTETIDWVSSNTTVATVSGGKVTGLAEGKATITAQAKKGETVLAEADCEVSVTVPFTSNPVLKSTKKYGSKDYEGAHDNGYRLSFSDSGSGATNYQLLCDGSVMKGYENVQKDTDYEVLVPYGSHTYTVRASGNGHVKDYSISISVSGVMTDTQPYTWYCKTKKKVKTGGVTIPKGTTMVAVGRSPKKIKKFKNPKKVQVIYNGRKVWVPYKKLKGGVKARVNVKQDYSRSLKEYMVNNAAFSRKTNEGSAIRGRAITSGDDTLIWACLYTQRAYTFKKNSRGKWELVHSDRITTGKFSHPTRSSETSGIYTVNKKKAGKVWMVQQNGKRYYFTHASYITKGVSFHTGTWWASGKHRGSVIASGKPGTYGCIRMYTDGAKFIYANTTKNRTGVIVTRFD